MIFTSIKINNIGSSFYLIFFKKCEFFIKKSKIKKKKEKPFILFGFLTTESDCKPN